MYLGLDLSLSATGYAVIAENGQLITSGIIKPKKIKTKDDIDGLKRGLYIKDELVSILNEHELLHKIKHCAIESVFAGRNIAVTKKLCYLNSLFRELCMAFSIDYSIINPLELKAYISFPEKAKRKDKEMISTKVKNKYGIICDDDNEADAYVLARMNRDFHTKKYLRNTKEFLKGFISLEV